MNTVSASLQEKQCKITLTSTISSPFLSAFDLTEFEDCFYQGYYHQNQPDGKGIIIYKNGDCYYGEIEDNVMKGKGYFFPAMGGVIEGHFENHFANGFCLVSFPNGDQFKGFLRDGQINGKGIKYTANTNSWTYQIYENGEPVQELYKGEGEPINIEINVEADGLTVSNLRIAQELNATESYEGQMKGGLKNGLGIMHLEDQSKIFGVWKNNILQGLGVSLNPSGIVSLGHFEDGKLQGFGRRMEPNGHIYVGNFENDEYNGDGVLLDPRRKKVSLGKFKNGKFIARAPEGKDLDMMAKRGVCPELRKVLEEAPVGSSPHQETKSPDYKQFLHKIEEIVHSKVVLSNQTEVTKGQIPNFTGKTEIKLAKKFKEKLEENVERIQDMNPMTQSTELIKLARELLTDRSRSPFVSPGQSRSPYTQFLYDPAGWDVWERLNKRAGFEKNDEGTFGWLLNREDPNARPIVINNGVAGQNEAINNEMRPTNSFENPLIANQSSPSRLAPSIDPGMRRSPEHSPEFHNRHSGKKMSSRLPFGIPNSNPAMPVAVSSNRPSEDPLQTSSSEATEKIAPNEAKHLTAKQANLNKITPHKPLEIEIENPNGEKSDKPELTPEKYSARYVSPSNIYTPKEGATATKPQQFNAPENRTSTQNGNPENLVQQPQKPELRAPNQNIETKIDQMQPSEQIKAENTPGKETAAFKYPQYQPGKSYVSYHKGQPQTPNEDPSRKDKTNEPASGEKSFSSNRYSTPSQNSSADIPNSDTKSQENKPSIALADQVDKPERDARSPYQKDADKSPKYEIGKKYVPSPIKYVSPRSLEGAKNYTPYTSKTSSQENSHSKGEPSSDSQGGKKTPPTEDNKETKPIQTYGSYTPKYTSYSPKYSPRYTSSYEPKKYFPSANNPKHEGQNTDQIPNDKSKENSPEQDIGNDKQRNPEPLATPKGDSTNQTPEEIKLQTEKPNEVAVGQVKENETPKAQAITKYGKYQPSHPNLKPQPENRSEVPQQKDTEPVRDTHESEGGPIAKHKIEDAEDEQKPEQPEKKADHAQKAKPHDQRDTTREEKEEHPKLITESKHPESFELVQPTEDKKVEGKEVAKPMPNTSAEGKANPIPTKEKTNTSNKYKKHKQQPIHYKEEEAKLVDNNPNNLPAEKLKELQEGKPKEAIVSSYYLPTFDRANSQSHEKSDDASKKSNPADVMNESRSSERSKPSSNGDRIKPHSSDEGIEDEESFDQRIYKTKDVSLDLSKKNSENHGSQKHTPKSKYSDIFYQIPGIPKAESKKESSSEPNKLKNSSSSSSSSSSESRSLKPHSSDEGIENEDNSDGELHTEKPKEPMTLNEKEENLKQAEVKSNQVQPNKAKVLPSQQQKLQSTSEKPEDPRTQVKPQHATPSEEIKNVEEGEPIVFHSDQPETMQGTLSEITPELHKAEVMTFGQLAPKNAEKVKQTIAPKYHEENPQNTDVLDQPEKIHQEDPVLNPDSTNLHNKPRASDQKNSKHSNSAPKASPTKKGTDGKKAKQQTDEKIPEKVEKKPEESKGKSEESKGKPEESKKKDTKKKPDSKPKKTDEKLGKEKENPEDEANDLSTNIDQKSDSDQKSTARRSPRHEERPRDEASDKRRSDRPRRKDKEEQDPKPTKPTEEKAIVEEDNITLQSQKPVEVAAEQLTVKKGEKQKQTAAPIQVKNQPQKAKVLTQTEPKEPNGKSMEREAEREPTPENSKSQKQELPKKKSKKAQLKEGTNTSLPENDPVKQNTLPSERKASPENDFDKDTGRSKNTAQSTAKLDLDPEDSSLRFITSKTDRSKNDDPKSLEQHLVGDNLEEINPEEKDDKHIQNIEQPEPIGNMTTNPQEKPEKAAVKVLPNSKQSQKKSQKSPQPKEKTDKPHESQFDPHKSNQLPREAIDLGSLLTPQKQLGQKTEDPLSTDPTPLKEEGSSKKAPKGKSKSKDVPKLQFPATGAKEDAGLLKEDLSQANEQPVGAVQTKDDHNIQHPSNENKEGAENVDPSNRLEVLHMQHEFSFEPQLPELTKEFTLGPVQEPPKKHPQKSSFSKKTKPEKLDTQNALPENEGAKDKGKTPTKKSGFELPYRLPNPKDDNKKNGSEDNKKHDLSKTSSESSKSDKERPDKSLEIHSADVSGSNEKHKEKSVPEKKTGDKKPKDHKKGKEKPHKDSKKPPAPVFYVLQKGSEGTEADNLKPQEESKKADLLDENNDVVNPFLSSEAKNGDAKGFEVTKGKPTAIDLNLGPHGNPQNNAKEKEQPQSNSDPTYSPSFKSTDSLTTQKESEEFKQNQPMGNKDADRSKLGDINSKKKKPPKAIALISPDQKPIVLNKSPSVDSPSFFPKTNERTADTPKSPFNNSRSNGNLEKTNESKDSKKPTGPTTPKYGLMKHPSQKSLKPSASNSRLENPQKDSSANKSKDPLNSVSNILQSQANIEEQESIRDKSHDQLNSISNVSKSEAIVEEPDSKTNDKQSTASQKKSKKPAPLKKERSNPGSQLRIPRAKGSKASNQFKIPGDSQNQSQSVDPVQRSELPESKKDLDNSKARIGDSLINNGSKSRITHDLSIDNPDNDSRVIEDSSRISSNTKKSERSRSEKDLPRKILYKLGKKSNKKLLVDSLQQDQGQESLPGAISERLQEEEEQQTQRKQETDPKVPEKLIDTIKHSPRIEEKAEEESSEDEFAGITKFTNYLKKGYFNYFTSPKVCEMQKKAKERETFRQDMHRKGKYYPIHEPCIPEEGGYQLTNRSYSPKMYQEVFGDMTDLKFFPQSSPLNHHFYHPHDYSEINEGSPDKQPKYNIRDTAVVDRTKKAGGNNFKQINKTEPAHY